jgi:hypothetical protein
LTILVTALVVAVLSIESVISSFDPARAPDSRPVAIALSPSALDVVHVPAIVSKSTIWW